MRAILRKAGLSLLKIVAVIGTYLIGIQITGNSRQLSLAKCTARTSRRLPAFKFMRRRMASDPS